MHKRRTRSFTGLVAAVASLLATAVTLSPPASATALGNTGSGRPALAFSGGRLYVAWTGSSGDPATKDLNLGWSTSLGVRIQKVLTGEKTPVNEGPGLVDDAVDNTGGSGKGVYVAWIAGNNANTLTAEYFDGTTLSCRTSFTGITSPHGPALGRDFSGNRYISWADAAGHLNVARLDSSACATTRTMRLVSRVTLPDVTSASPSLAFDQSSAGLGLMIAWTGTDGGVNTATYDGTTTLKLRGSVDPTVAAVGAPLVVSDYSDNYLSFRGVDGKSYLGYSEGQFPPHYRPVGSTYSRGLSSPIGGNTPGGLIAYFDLSGHLNISGRCCGLE